MGAATGQDAPSPGHAGSRRSEQWNRQSAVLDLSRPRWLACSGGSLARDLVCVSTYVRPSGSATVCRLGREVDRSIAHPRWRVQAERRGSGTLSGRGTRAAAGQSSGQGNLLSWAVSASVGGSLAVVARSRPRALGQGDTGLMLLHAAACREGREVERSRVGRLAHQCNSWQGAGGTFSSPCVPTMP